MSDEVSKNKQGLASALLSIEQKDLPLEVKADIYRMLNQFIHLVAGTLYAADVEGMVNIQDAISRLLYENKARLEGKIAENRRNRFTLVEDDDPPDEAA